MKRRGTRVLWCGLALAVLLTPAAVWACPGCKESLFDPGQLAQKRSTAIGYALSITLMLSMPVVLVGGSTVLLVRAHRRKRRAPPPQSVDSSPLSG